MSLVVETSNGASGEVATVGNEGLVGTPIFLGTDRSPTRVFSQVAGDLIRVPAMYFRRLVDTNGPFQLVVRRYIQAFVNTLSQTVVCNNAHPVDQRMCRWLLMTHDRVGSDTFQLTQDFLAQMLGVRRPSVSVVARILYDAGLIRYVRGRITIVDRAKLEAAACECYFVVRNEFDRLFESTAA